MSAVVNVALPVFAIILAGWAAGRIGLLGSASSEALNKFVYWIALPPLLFLAMARSDVSTLWQPNFIGAYLGAIVILWLASGGLGWLMHRETPSNCVMQGMNATFANTGYMGIPLFVAAFGEAGVLPALIATVIHSAIAIGIAVVALELTSSDGGKGVLTALKDVFLALIKNPLVVSPAAGILWAAFALPLPTPIVNWFELLGAAASPAALFSIGLFMAGQKLAADLAEVGWITVVKLIWQPLLAYLLAITIFPMDPFWVASAVLLSALPTGGLTFVIAQQYGVYIRRTSGVILISTVLSVVTLTLLLAVYTPRYGIH